MTSAQVLVVADLFNGGPSELFAGDVLPLVDEVGALPRNRQGHDSTRFVQIPAFDQLLVAIARDVQKAMLRGHGSKRFFIANNQDCTHSGTHWVSVVYEISPKQNSPAAQPAAALAVTHQLATRNALAQDFG